MTPRQRVLIVAWVVLVATVTMLLVASVVDTAHGAVCCVTCHGEASCSGCHEKAAPETDVDEPAPAAPAAFDPDELTRSQWGPDGTYYVYVVGVHYEHEELEPGGLLYEAERIVADSGAPYEAVGPGRIIADDQGEDPALYGETEATATIDETVTP